MRIDSYYNSRKKRLLDIFLAGAILIVLAPILVGCYFCLLKKNGAPIIYKQKRTGKNKQPFTIYKIRTMKVGAEFLQKKLMKKNEAPFPMFKIINDPRFTSTGKILSKYGLDELPQLINILKGEMSFVGPRPLPVDQASQLDDTWNFRYKVRPGILSKWALSNERHKSLITWKKLEKDGLKKGSISSDLAIIFNTVFKLFLKNKF